MTVVKNPYNAKTDAWISNPSAQEKQQNEYGLNRHYGQDQNGNRVLLQIGKNGKASQAMLPDAVSLSKAVRKVEAKTATVLIDPITRQPITTIAKDIAGAKSQKAQGKLRGDAIARAPESIERSKALIGTIDAPPVNDALDGGVGQFYQYWLNMLRKNKGRDAVSRIDQVNGGVFLEAYNLLGGRGGIAEVEEQKAEQVFSRLNRAQDTATVRHANKNLRDISKSAVKRQQVKLGLPPDGIPEPVQKPEPDKKAKKIAPKGVTAEA